MPNTKSRRSISTSLDWIYEKKIRWVNHIQFIQFIMIFILWGFQRYITTFWSCHFSIVDIQACAGDDDHHGPFLARKFAAPAGGVVHLEVAAARRLLLRRTGSPGSRVAEANNIFTCGQKFNIVKQHILGWLVLWNIIYIFFSIYWECHHPNWRTHICQRGGSTTNQ